MKRSAACALALPLLFEPGTEEGACELVARHASARPTRGGGPNEDAFFTRISPDGSRITCATYLGGSQVDGGAAIVAEGSGYVWLAGFSESTDFPTRRALQPAFAGGQADAFLARLGCDSPPGDAGNSLLGVKSASGIAWSWRDAAGAADHALWRDLLRSGSFLAEAGRAVSGTPPLQVAWPAEPLVFHRVAGESCCGVGPR